MHEPEKSIAAMRKYIQISDMIVKLLDEQGVLPDDANPALLWTAAASMTLFCKTQAQFEEMETKALAALAAMFDAAWKEQQE